MKRNVMFFFGGVLLGMILMLLVLAGITMYPCYFDNNCGDAGAQRFYNETATTIRLTNNWVETQIANTQTAKFEMQTKAP